MKTRVSREEYIKLAKELKDLAISIGCTLSFTKKNHPLYKKKSVWGSYSPIKKTCKIRAKGKASRMDILFVMAHEVRHALHDHTGMFSDYYKKENLDWWNWALRATNRKPRAKLPSRKIAHNAELECDVWAANWLKSKGYKKKKKRLYPYSHTMAYQLHRYVALRKVHDGL